MQPVHKALMTRISKSHTAHTHRQDATYQKVKRTKDKNIDEKIQAENRVRRISNGKNLIKSIVPSCECYKVGR